VPDTVSDGAEDVGETVVSGTVSGGAGRSISMHSGDPGGKVDGRAGSSPCAGTAAPIAMRDHALHVAAHVFDSGEELAHGECYADRVAMGEHHFVTDEFLCGALQRVSDRDGAADYLLMLSLIGTTIATIVIAR
jgi:hypothetical protein